MIEVTILLKKSKVNYQLKRKDKSNAIVARIEKIYDIFNSCKY